MSAESLDRHGKRGRDESYASGGQLWTEDDLLTDDIMTNTCNHQSCVNLTLQPPTGVRIGNVTAGTTMR